jgi:hypothetical protein
MVGNWRKDRGLSGNIRASFEGSRARIGDRGSGNRPQRARLGPVAKTRILYSRRKFGNGFAFRGCNGWKALVIVAREGRSNLRQGFVQLRNCSRVGPGCYTTKKKCNFRQLSNLDDRQFLAICHLPSAISNRLRVPPPARGVLADTAKRREYFRETLALVPFHPSIPLRRNGLKSEG